MESVSQAYKQNIYAPSRMITAKIAFEIIDETSVEDVTIVSSFDQAPISRIEQVFDRKRSMSYRYATFEPDYFKLDGSMKLPPEDYEQGDELGFWSDEICDANGLYINNPTISISFGGPHNAIGITVTFDTINNEYASEFTLVVIAYEGGILLNQDFVGNDSPIFVLTQNLEGVGTINLIITKWAKGNRRARVTEVDFGIVQEYTGKDLINLSVVEEMDIVGSTVPSNELHFTLDNQLRLFNILNPDGIYRFILPKQQVRAYMGLQIGETEEDIEFVQVGKYYLTEWQTDEGALTTSFTARDIFDQLETVSYNGALGVTNLFLLAEDILLKANITDYQIDSRLTGEQTNGFTEPVSARSALQSVSIAGRAVIYQDRRGTLRIERIDPLEVSTGFITFPGPDTYAGLTTPEVSNDYDFQAIDFENTFAEPQINLSEPVQTLIFLVRDGSPEGTEVIFQNPLVLKNGASYKIENPLINTTLHAGRVADWMFTEYNVRGYYRANWRQNPALTCGDAVMIEDSFGQKKKARITKQEYQFEGFLTGNTEAIGGV
jgi:hypothetical protein